MVWTFGWMWVGLEIWLGLDIWLRGSFTWIGDLVGLGWTICWVE